MRAEKLQNLLATLDKRLERIDKSVQRAERGKFTLSISGELFAIRGLVRRHLSKPDALRLNDVEDLERRIDSLHDAAFRDPLITNSASPGPRELNEIFADNGYLKNLTAGMRIGLVQLTPEDVLEATPGQKTAAYQFGFSDGTLILVDQPLRPLAEEASIAMGALATAIEHGQYVNEDLVTSNASPRLRSAFIRLQETMLTYANIVQVGSCAHLCQRQVQAEAEELSSSQLGLLVGHLESVFKALAQFQDWRIFSENAVTADIDAYSVRLLVSSADAIAKELAGVPAVDPSVAAALTTVSDWAGSQEKPDRRDVLSLARTLENVWSAIVREVLAVGREVVKLGRTGVAAGIVAILVAGSVASIPVLRKIPGAEWVESAYSYFTANPVLPPK